MATLTASDFIERARPLLDGSALREAESLADQSPDVHHIAAELVRRHRLTQYQADELLQGRGEHLLLGAYILLEPIGKGGMGQVFRARQKVLERECAVKIIRKDRLQSDESIERFLREARAAAKVNHPNIVAIHDANDAGGVHYLAMELLAGVTLADFVKKIGPLSIGHACRYVRQAALGLQHAHEQGLVHRDIKPQNLFLENTTDQVKILDLGLARIREVRTDDETATGDLTREGEVMGTPDYMAPEQALASRSADHRADIYSLGCTLYFLLTGRPPFPGGSLTEKLLAHQQKEPIALDQLRSGAPERLVHALKQAMAKQPDDRFQTPAEFAEALAPLENNEQIIAAPPPVTAVQDTLPGRPHETTTSRPIESIAQPRASNSTNVLLVLALIAAFACCPIAIVGGGIFCTGWHVLLGAAHDDGGVIHQAERAPLPIENVEQVKPPPKLNGPIKPPPIKDMEIKPFKTFDGRNFVLSADGKKMIHDVSDTVLTFEVRDFENGKRLFDLPKGKEGVGFAAGTPHRVVAAKDRTSMFLLDAQTGKELGNFHNPSAGFAEYVPAPDEKTALVAAGKLLIVWDLVDGKEIHRATLPDFPKHVSYCAAKKLSLAVCGKRVQTWSLPNDIAEREYVGFAGGDIRSTAISPDGNWVVAGDGTGTLYLWRADEPAKPRALDGGHAGSVQSVAFSADGGTILSGCAGGRIAHWHVATATRIHSGMVGSGVTKVGLHPDGNLAVSASTDKKIRVWRLPQ